VVADKHDAAVAIGHFRSLRDELLSHAILYPFMASGFTGALLLTQQYSPI